jgi:hypothetical protein
MMEVFQQVDAMSFGSHAFMLVTVEIPCSRSQPTTFNYAFTSRYIKAALGHMRFYGWSPWKVDFVDLSHWTNHLDAGLHWSFEYDGLTMIARGKNFGFWGSCLSFSHVISVV